VAPEVDRASPLWQALRRRRKQLADEQGVPPYVIFHDATLAQMAHERPASRAEFAELSGVGALKLERYADAFLEVIREHAPADPHPS
jgi:ATP-dependent DNA helicase RecQ